MNKYKAIEILRWIAILPGGIISGILVLFPLHWILTSWFDEGSTLHINEDDLHSIEYFLSPIFTASAFVYFGALIAPDKRIKVSKILFVLYLISLFIVFIFVRSNLFIDHFGDNFIVERSKVRYVQIILQIAAGYGGMHLIKLRDDEYC